MDVLPAKILRLVRRFEEDEGSVLFDADGDGDLDLLVTYGDMRFSDTSQYYQPRLYLNDGKGNFTYKPKCHS